MHGLDLVVSFLGSIVSWPVLLFANVYDDERGRPAVGHRRHPDPDLPVARWDDRPVTVADAIDFWSFAGAAANVIMQLALPPVGHGVAESTVTSGSPLHHP